MSGAQSPSAHDVGQGGSDGTVSRRSGLVQNVGKVGASHVRRWGELVGG